MQRQGEASQAANDVPPLECMMPVNQGEKLWPKTDSEKCWKTEPGGIKKKGGKNKGEVW